MVRYCRMRYRIEVLGDDGNDDDEDGESDEDVSDATDNAENDTRTDYKVLLNDHPELINRRSESKGLAEASEMVSCYPLCFKASRVGVILWFT